MGGAIAHPLYSPLPPPPCSYGHATLIILLKSSILNRKYKFISVLTSPIPFYTKELYYVLSAYT